MKNLNNLTFGIRRLFGWASEQEISQRDAADLRMLSEGFLQAFSKIKYRPANDRPVSIDNINEVYIHPHRPKLLTLQTNLRNPGGMYIPVAIEFMENVWGYPSFKRAVELLQFNLVSTVEDSPLLMGLNPRNFSITKTGRQSGPKQDIYTASWRQDFSLEVVLVEAPHKWRAHKTLEVSPAAPEVNEAAIEVPQSSQMELTQ